MKLTLNVFLILFTTLAFSAEPQWPVIVSYPDDTPNAVLDEAKDAIRQAVCNAQPCQGATSTMQLLIDFQGGIITYEYNLIKAFAAKAPAKGLSTVQALGSSNNVLIEKDRTVTVNDS